MSRRRTAWLLTLVLLLELAVLCCACSRIACHHCAHGPRCAVCEYVKLGLRTAFLMPSAVLTLIALMVCSGHARAVGPSGHGYTLYDQRVKLND